MPQTIQIKTDTNQQNFKSMLNIQFKDKREAPFWVMEKSFSIGRSKKNTLCIDDDTVSQQHARIINNGETFLLKDLGSQAGTYVNGRRITQKNIACGDTIAIGKVELLVIDPIIEHGDDYWSLIADSSWLSGQEFPLIGKQGDTISIGRSSDCDIVFPGTHLSRRHAEITLDEHTLKIHDLNSANGTFINDKKIAVANLYPGDRLRLDVYSFRVFGPGIKLPRSATTTFDAIPDDIEDLESSRGPKQWKVKPTSPGNREELDLYKRRHRNLIIGSLLTFVLASIVIYVVLGLSGVLT